MGMRIGSSEIRSWLRCRRQWWLRYYRGYMTPEGDNRPANVGNMVHKALETYYGTATAVQPLDSLLPMYEKMLESFPNLEESLTRDRDLAVTMVTAYMDWLKDTLVDIDLDYYESESAVEAPLGDTGFILTARIDARAKRKSTGGRVSMDHKTVKSLDELVKTAQIDGQFLSYNLVDMLASEDQSKGDGLIINMLRRVDSANPNAKPPYFSRYEVHHNLQELRSHWKHLVAICTQIEKATNQLKSGMDHQTVVPPSPSKDCSWGCNFKGVCPMFDNGSNAEGFLGAMYTKGKQYDHQDVAREETK